MEDEFGDRMKLYESEGTSSRLDLELPICIRIDGRSFSKFTQSYKKPFDQRISNAMRAACYALVEETNARIGYVQSDEISLIVMANEGGSVLFDGKAHKLNSVLASHASVHFQTALMREDPEVREAALAGKMKLPSFDCRVWNLPSRDEAANAILWRAQDARRNSISSTCRSLFSAKQMHKKSQRDMLEMIASKGVDFEGDFSVEDRQGVYYQRVLKRVPIDQETWDGIPEHKRPDSREVMRSSIEIVQMPYFSDVENRVEVIFDREEPRLIDRSEMALS